MPRKPDAKRATTLRFTGHADVYVTGVPQSDLSIVETPRAPHEVTLARARELVATRLYEADGPLGPEEDPTETTSEPRQDAAAEED